MTTNNPEELGTLALEAMLIEVSVTPKPGLVDRNNSGAHHDMNFFTFLRSAASLRSSFEEFARAGFVGGSRNFSPAQVFPLIRKIGLEAEKRMFAATDGINTHKGEIFSLGLLSSCAGFLTGKSETLTAEKVMTLASEMCHGICEKDFAGVRNKKTLTKGERVYLEHGITGIRGEAEAGYPAVRDVGLPALRKYLADGLSLNDALAFTLIHIMANAQDTNIISRHDLKTAEIVMKRAEKILAENSGLDGIRELDREFIAEYISPGGSGDLLAVTYFLQRLEFREDDNTMLKV